MSAALLRYRHYSRHPAPITEVYPCRQRPDMKPRGLWLSVEGDGDGWRDWCEANQPRWVAEWTHIYNVTLAPNANVLLLTSPAEIWDFNKRYSCSSPWDSRIFWYIAWDKVSAAYDGIVIAPYQWACRLDEEAPWYYGWDCASGCIWEPRAIASLELETDERKEAADGHD